MIYLDTSVALAHLLSEDRRPPDELWAEELVTSRLLELRADVLERALQPFPTPVRTLDALHLASLAFLRERGRAVVLASYDRRMVEAAVAMGIEVYPL